MVLPASREPASGFFPGDGSRMFGAGHWTEFLEDQLGDGF